MFRVAKMVVCLAVAIVALSGEVSGDTEATPLADRVNGLAKNGLISTSIGVTRRGTAIDAVIAPADLDFHTEKTRILLVAGAHGDTRSPIVATNWMQWFYQHADAANYRERFVLSAIPCVNPDGMALGDAPHNGVGGTPSQGYPPTGGAYNSKTDPEAAYVWRWIGMHAPDLVIELMAGDEIRWRVNSKANDRLVRMAGRLNHVLAFDPDDSLTAQLTITQPSEVGTIPALQLSLTENCDKSPLMELLDAASDSGFRGPSPARLEMQRRLARTPEQITADLLEHYGKQLKQVVYIQSLAVIGRMRHLERVAQENSQAPNYTPIEAIVEDYFNGDKPAALKSGSDLSGHLIFSELARRAEGVRRTRYIELARAAADLAFDEQGKMKSSMPFHSEMSDALFMGGPILAQVGTLTGENKYYDACAQHLKFMKALVLREDNLYRHSPLDESAWGRGNGFPALGVAMCLDALPDDHAARAELLEGFQLHMAALARHQDPTGCWHQVIDHPESYREFTATCMITYVMLRGISQGWLDDETYSPLVDRAWYAIRTRIGKGGELVDVCTGTGKQQSLRDYYDRTALLGRDDRGGAMALLVANEISDAQPRLSSEKK
ncbi:MAG TPA: glycoside hydrolase family 88 protein [Pirellulaceae bacterium]|nr:glycoside hydrolase family 88 protein [Planctomycetales bacterium]HRX77599.1 glycoside hydrolase family 88 protein [Pirellulaceae bacterium]